MGKLMSYWVPKCGKPHTDRGCCCWVACGSGQKGFREEWHGATSGRDADLSQDSGPFTPSSSDPPSYQQSGAWGVWSPESQWSFRVLPNETHVSSAAAQEMCPHLPESWLTFAANEALYHFVSPQRDEAHGELVISGVYSWSGISIYPYVYALIYLPKFSNKR